MKNRNKLVHQNLTPTLKFNNFFLHSFFPLFCLLHVCVFLFSFDAILKFLRFSNVRFLYFFSFCPFVLLNVPFFTLSDLFQSLFISLFLLCSFCMLFSDCPLNRFFNVHFFTLFSIFFSHSLLDCFL